LTVERPSTGPKRDGDSDRYDHGVLLFEFTIEPFVEGQPGPHVTSAIAAAEALGVRAEFGPFGTTCVVPAAQAGAIAEAIISAAFANGATHVSLHAERRTDDE
jgi:uncharacterized protein YqgV (UPF0045/DUF77 family)